MARVVLIVDSDTGSLVDVAGYSRESGRYSRFARRMMSTHVNPQLDYGVNGGNSLTISKGGNAGESINLIADMVNVSGGLKVGGKTIGEISEEGKESVLGRVVGTDGEISVSTVLDEETGKTARKVSLDQAVSTMLEHVDELVDSIDETIARISEALSGVESGLEDLAGEVETIASRLDDIENGYASRADVAGVADGIYISDEDTLEDVKDKLGILLFRIESLAGGG